MPSGIGTIVRFAWRQVSGPTVTLSNPNGAVTLFRAPRTRNVVDLIFALTVTDDQGATAEDQVKVRVLSKEDDDD